MLNDVIDSGLLIGDRIVKIGRLVGWIVDPRGLNVVEHLDVGGWDLRFDIVVLLRGKVERVVFDLDGLWDVGHSSLHLFHYGTIIYKKM